MSTFNLLQKLDTDRLTQKIAHGYPLTAQVQMIFHRTIEFG